jgi:hypothetical protein
MPTPLSRLGPCGALLDKPAVAPERRHESSVAAARLAFSYPALVRGLSPTARCCRRSRGFELLNAGALRGLTPTARCRRRSRGLVRAEHCWTSQQWHPAIIWTGDYPRHGPVRPVIVRGREAKLSAGCFKSLGMLGSCARQAARLAWPPR